MNRPTATALPLPEFVALIALLISMGAFAIDAMLPAIPSIARELHAPNGTGFHIVTALFAGYCVGQAIFGPLSDTIGRKPAIYGGAGLFMSGCLVSIVASTFSAMLLGRVLQGAGSAAVRVVSTALVRDQYSGSRMARIMALVMAIFIIVPVLAPSIGQALLVHYRWEAIFVALLLQGSIGVLWFAARQPETLPSERRKPASVTTLLADAQEVIRNRVAVGYMIVSGLMFGGMVGYLATAQPILQDLYGVGDAFPLYFGGLASAIGLSSIVNSRLVERVGMRAVSTFALWLITISAGAFVLLALSRDSTPPLWSLVVFLFCAFAGIGLTFGNFSAMAMEPLGRLAGIGAAVVGSGSTLVSLLVGSLIGQCYDGTVMPLALGFAGVGPLALLVMTASERARPKPIIDA